MISQESTAEGMPRVRVQKKKSEMRRGPVMVVASA